MYPETWLYISQGEDLGHSTVSAAKNKIVIQTVKENEGKKKKESVEFVFNNELFWTFKSEICFSMNLLFSKFKLVISDLSAH